MNNYMILMAVEFPVSRTVSVVAVVTLAIISTMMHGFLVEREVVDIIIILYSHDFHGLFISMHSSLSLSSMSMCLCVQAYRDMP